MELGGGPLGSMSDPAGSLPSMGALFSCGLPHMSLQRCPRTISLCCSSSTARSAAERSAYVTKAQCLFAITCTGERRVSKRRGQFGREQSACVFLDCRNAWSGQGIWHVPMPLWRHGVHVRHDTRFSANMTDGAGRAIHILGLGFTILCNVSHASRRASLTPWPHTYHRIHQGW